MNYKEIETGEPTIKTVQLEMNEEQARFIKYVLEYFAFYTLFDHRSRAASKLAKEIPGSSFGWNHLNL